MRLLDVYDPDGNRIQLAQELLDSLAARPVGIHDVRFLRDMLRHAYHWRLAEDTERPGLPLRAELGPRAATPACSRSKARTPTGRRGTGCSREREPGFGFVDEATPELTIAVVPSRRGKGAGKELLEALLDARARGRATHAVSLSAAHGADARTTSASASRPSREAEHAVTMLARL